MILSSFVFFSVSLCLYFIREEYEFDHSCTSSTKGLSSITIIQNLFWNLLYSAEYLKLCLSREEYRMLVLACICHLYLLLHELFLIATFLQKYRINILRCCDKFKTISIICFSLLFAISWLEIYEEVYLCLFCASLWIPQILHNVANGCAAQMNYLVISLSVVQLLFPFYIKGNSQNILELEPNSSWVMNTLVFVLLQIFVICLQSWCGARFFLSNCVCLFITKIYLSVESGVTCENYIECIICMEYIDLKRIVDNNLNIHKNIYIACCGHKYHINCMKEWLKHQNHCPLCRCKQ